MRRFRTDATVVAYAAEAWLARPGIRGLFAVDSHTQGNPTRVLFGDVGIPAGATVFEARDHLRDHHDDIRRLLVHEPRGGNLMCAVVPFSSSHPDADIAAVIMEQDEYVPMCGHCIIGLVTTLVELDLVPEIETLGDTKILRIETPAGIVHTRVLLDGMRVRKVQLENVASYVAARDLPLVLADGSQIPVDVLYGGDHYITVDADCVELALVPEEASRIIEIAAAVRTAFQSSHSLGNPITGDPERVYQVMFRKVLSEGPLIVANTVVAPPGEIDRSPCGTGTSSLVAWAVTSGLLTVGEEMTSRGITGTTFTAKALLETTVGSKEAIMPSVEGSAYITGFSTWVLDSRDPFPQGFVIYR